MILGRVVFMSLLPWLMAYVRFTALAHGFRSGDLQKGVFCLPDPLRGIDLGSVPCIPYINTYGSKFLTKTLTWHSLDLAPRLRPWDLANAARCAAKLTV